ncbi:MAG: CARDB domain-containing protein [Candidatus Eisenbacteria bacterium]|nr:CARDB domain-containing protein [Candidatus Eisenbacteria bacterium]
MPYAIYFQNLPTATAPAAVVDIRDQLDPSLDVRRFRLTDFAWGDSQIVVPPNRSYYHTQVNLSDGNLLDIDAGVNASTREAHWTFRTLDPNTGQIPTDPLAGFLPPDDSTGIGQGHVGFTILADPNVPAGTEITNTASIVFDTNAPIITNTVSNTLRDALADLTITSAVVAAGESAVLEGASATVMATVTNQGEVAAPGLDVRVFDGDPDAGGALVGTVQLVNGLGVGATAEVGIPYIPSGVVGSRSLFAVADRANTIREADEDNNTLPVTVAVSGRSYTIHYAAGVNMIAPPLAAIPGLKARNLADRIGASLVVGLDSTGAFTSFVPDVMSGDGFDIEGSQGYIVVANAAGSATFDGVTHEATVPVRSGVNMLSLPLDPGEPYTAGDLCTALGAGQTIRYDTGAQRFVTYIPGFSDGQGFELQGGGGYLATTGSAVSAVFTGAGWNGEGPVISKAPELLSESSPETPEGAAVFGVAGDVLLATGWDTPTHAGASYRIEITNARTGFQASSRSSGDTGQYGAALLDVTNATSVRAGDEIRVDVKSPAGTKLGETVSYQVTSEDVKHGFARVDVTASRVPVFSILHAPFPEPMLEKAHIRFQLARKGRVTLRVFDVAGRLVDTLEDRELEVGYYEKVWSGQTAAGRRAAAGVYFVRLQAPDYAAAHRVTLVY